MKQNVLNTLHNNSKKMKRNSSSLVQLMYTAKKILGTSACKKEYKMLYIYMAWPCYVKTNK